ncbi:SDR family NAD(P)-dependent oxidoreductase [Thermogemmata fonticola]|jgi:NAD(P)-dependent dehydrogenase (short-subunit alcohol dehydrogenase family)|uniref:SDR family oxidoreductase n=1 Tax=Thermogemmata fonticola TaxID=2755323 RepID=A0A7V8VCT4_9BACT|nr:SDR family oxidoreductase [Thermogemmata fonticola]MBA2225659.1 SDR family oxidoreductase [Thermogemmata fonticola]
MLSGKAALVTGSSQGIGLGVARAFAASGAKVVLTSEKPLPHCPEVQRILSDYEHTRYIQADLLQEGEPERLLAEAWQAFAGLDVLVNNVGTYKEPPLEQLTRRDFDFIFGLNVWSAIALSREFVRRLKAEKRPGRILFSSSLNASRSEPQHTLYDASKGAINALCRQLAVELAPFGITTAAVAPGLVETPLTDFGLKSTPSERHAVMEQIPLRRIASVEDVAWWYVFLASDKAAYATGTIVVVDGGLDAQQMAFRPISPYEKG